VGIGRFRCGRASRSAWDNGWLVVALPIGVVAVTVGANLCFDGAVGTRRR
jgi:hypothetical protein